MKRIMVFSLDETNWIAYFETNQINFDHTNKTKFIVSPMKWTTCLISTKPIAWLKVGWYFHGWFVDCAGEHAESEATGKLRNSSIYPGRYEVMTCDGRDERRMTDGKDRRMWSRLAPDNFNYRLFVRRSQRDPDTIMPRPVDSIHADQSTYQQSWNNDRTPNKCNGPSITLFTRKPQ